MADPCYLTITPTTPFASLHFFFVYPSSFPPLPSSRQFSQTVCGLRWHTGHGGCSSAHSGWGIEETSGVWVGKVGGSDGRLPVSHQHSPETKTILSHTDNYAGILRSNLKFQMTLASFFSCKGRKYCNYYNMKC